MNEVNVIIGQNMAYAKDVLSIDLALDIKSLTNTVMLERNGERWLIFTSSERIQHNLRGVKIKRLVIAGYQHWFNDIMPMVRAYGLLTDDCKIERL